MISHHRANPPTSFGPGMCPSVEAPPAGSSGVARSGPRTRCRGGPAPAPADECLLGKLPQSFASATPLSGGGPHSLRTLTLPRRRAPRFPPFGVLTPSLQRSHHVASQKHGSTQFDQGGGSWPSA